jgi:Na+-transporting NADH:ubiquinone oxidoreductase subunit C
MLQRNGIPYILGFCVAVCLVCSLIVSSAAVGLKERQENNKILDRQTKVLSVAGLMDESNPLEPAEIQSLFNKRIRSIVVDLESGKEDVEMTKDAASFDQKKSLMDPDMSKEAPKNRAGVRRIPNKALVYQVSKQEMADDGSGFELDQYIFPVEGKGLWSTLYGYLAVAPDCNQIKGLTFYAHLETPGLGGEVDNPSWKAKWPGRLVYGDKGSEPSSWKDVQIGVKKGLAGTPSEDPYQVDGLSGATITSNGVTYLLHFWMGEHGFKKFIQNTLGQSS